MSPRFAVDNPARISFIAAGGSAFVPLPVRAQTHFNAADPIFTEDGVHFPKPPPLIAGEHTAPELAQANAGPLAVWTGEVAHACACAERQAKAAKNNRKTTELRDVVMEILLP